MYHIKPVVPRATRQHRIQTHVAKESIFTITFRIFCNKDPVTCYLQIMVTIRGGKSTSNHAMSKKNNVIAFVAMALEVSVLSPTATVAE